MTTEAAHRPPGREAGPCKAPEARAFPSERGTYVLILSVPLTTSLKVGRLGAFAVPAGYYAYVGSAHGSGGLDGRLRQHFDTSGRLRWHIDYLRSVAAIAEVWFMESDSKLERRWADVLRRMASLRPFVAGFGSSDYRRGRTTHLYHAGRKPSFHEFEERLRDVYSLTEIGTLTRWESEPGA